MKQEQTNTKVAIGRSAFKPAVNMNLINQQIRKRLDDTKLCISR